MLAAVPPEARGECWWLVRRDGTVVAGDSGGGVALLLELRLTRPLGRLLQRTRASPLVETYNRLAALKAKWDPSNFLRHNQNIEPSGTWGAWKDHDPRAGGSGSGRPL